LKNELRLIIDNVERITDNNTGLLVQIAVNYGGKDEIVRAVNSLLDNCVTHISEEDIEKSLDTYGTPAPDLMIRTGGEMRLSNFLIWQLAYSELYFSETLWPDFNKDEFLSAIRYYQNRERRFGGLSN